MNDEVPEPEPEAGPEPTSGDIVLLCHPRNVANLVQAFEAEIAHAEGALPLSILWSGTSSVLHQGVIVLTWDKAMPTAFLQSLARDHEVFDYVSYTYNWRASGDSEEDGHQEPREQASQGQESQASDTPQRV